MITPYTLRKKIAQCLRHRFPQLLHEEIEDIISELYLEWHMSFSRTDNKSKFGEAWIMTVAQRRALDLMRRKDSLPETEHYDSIENDKQDGHSLQHHHLIEYLNEYIALLPFAMRLLIVKHYSEGYSYEEIALQQGKTKESIKKQTQRALVRLRRILSSEEK
ncbi:MAG TPA: sigma-70 family RNA polymerase sigma factor [Bacteroidia bacterium]|nr:sigma-70 family RNA polymerase sigma factor [Bacteroidia bacterium]